MPEFDANDPEVGLVPRIDKDTSGLLGVAITPTATTALGQQFCNKTTPRSSNALVWGGDSSEHDVSLRSGPGLYSFFDKERYNIYLVDVKGTDCMSLWIMVRLSRLTRTIFLSL